MKCEKIAPKIGHIGHISTYLGVPKDMEDPEQTIFSDSYIKQINDKIMSIHYTYHNLKQTEEQTT